MLKVSIEIFLKHLLRGTVFYIKKKKKKNDEMYEDRND